MTSEGEAPLIQAATAEQGDPQPHVVMIVANDVSADTRVRKMAHDVAAAGAQVTVVGLSSSGQREETLIGEATVIRLPLVMNMARPPRATFRSYRLSKSTHEIKNKVPALRDQFLSHQREIGAEIGWMRKQYFVQRRARLDGANELAVRRQQSIKKREMALRKLQKQFARWPKPLRWAIQKPLGLFIRIDGILGRILARRLRNRTAKKEDRLISRLHKRENRMRDRLAGSQQKYENARKRLIRKLDSAANPRKEPRPDSVDWRTELPELHDYDKTFDRTIDSLKPDLLHVHDVHLLGIGARAVGRLQVMGADVPLLYDAHEYVRGLSRYSKRTLAAWTNLEQEYFHHADRVITVSEPLADLLERVYEMERRPTVVMNIPSVNQGGHGSVRSAAGVDNDVPLLVYSGGLDRTRGVHTVVAALEQLPGVHLAIVAKATSPYVQDLMSIAETGGYADRLHIVPFVEPQDVVTYLSSATVGVHPMVAGPMNHEIALPNKIFEYMHAGLPIVVSNCRAMSALVTELEIGEAFISENPDSMAASVRKVLENLDRYHQAYRDQPDLLDRFSWLRQRHKLFDVYAEMLGETWQVNDQIIGTLPSGTRIETGSRKLLLGPKNMAGQAWEWAKAVERNYPEVKTEVIEIVRPNKLEFPSDRRILGTTWQSLEWQLQWALRVGTSFSHVLLESGSGILGNLNGGRLTDDLGFLKQHAIEVGVILHGSEVRDPRVHRKLLAESPFHDADALASRLEASADSVLGMLSDFDGPVFVSTLDLLDYVPNAIWLPQVISLKKWQPRPLSERSGPLKVLYAPTDPVLKGSSHVAEIGGRLAAEGLIDLQVVEGIPPEAMPELMSNHDVLIDGLVLGLYGTTSVEGMASGRIVLANLARVLDRQPEQPPIVHVTPDTLEEALRAIANDPGGYRSKAESGPAYVKRFHDGRFAASQLANFLGIELTEDPDP